MIFVPFQISLYFNCLFLGDDRIKGSFITRRGFNPVCTVKLDNWNLLIYVHYLENLVNLYFIYISISCIRMEKRWMGMGSSYNIPQDFLIKRW
jgi:hypothetical protein